MSILTRSSKIAAQQQEEDGAVAVSPDGKTLYIVNAKGKGSGANAGKLHDPKTPTYVGALEYGGVQAVPLASLADTTSMTDAVIAANTYAVRGLYKVERASQKSSE
jgi:hypothetical protein